MCFLVTKCGLETRPSHQGFLWPKSFVVCDPSLATKECSVNHVTTAKLLTQDNKLCSVNTQSDNFQSCKVWTVHKCIQACYCNPMLHLWRFLMKRQPLAPCRVIRACWKWAIIGADMWSNCACRMYKCRSCARFKAQKHMFYIWHRKERVCVAQAEVLRSVGFLHCFLIKTQIVT